MEKKKTILAIILFVLFVFIFFLGFNIWHNNLGNNKNTYKNYNNLEIISSNGKYVLAIDEKVNDYYTYAIFKGLSFNGYKKVFDLKDEQNIESRFVTWTKNRVYIFGNYPKYYNLENASSKSIDLLKLLNQKTGRIDRVLGIKDEFIYYEYSYNENNYIGKVDLELENVHEITSEDLPSELTY